MERAYIDLGFINIYWYSIIVMLAVFSAIMLILNEAKREKINTDFIYDIIFFTIPAGIVGARLYYVLFNWSEYQSHPLEILKIWHGGLAIHGAIIAGCLFIIGYCLYKHYNPLKILDIAVIGLIAGQIIGRWGNFFNKEAYGNITTYEFLRETLKLPHFIIEGMHINGFYHHPTFLYESLWNIVGLIILILIRERLKIKVGVLTFAYLIWYGIGRFFIEILRADSLLFFDIRIAQIISFMMVAIGIIGLIFIKNSKLPLYRKEEEKHEV